MFKIIYNTACFTTVPVTCVCCRADKVQAAHPGLQPVSRCHSYSIQCKHQYKCVSCSYKYVYTYIPMRYL